MALTNTAHAYGGVSKTLHWLTALFILTLLPTGYIAYQLPFDTSEELARKAWLFSLHKTVGIALFAVALTRITWALTQPKPGLLHPDRKVESWAAETVHWLLYGSLVLVPLSGWIHHAATTGFAPIWWPLGQDLPFVPKSEGVAAFMAGVHWIMARVLIVSLLLHIAGALKHHVIDRDATLRRMWFGRSDAPQTDAVHKHGGPITAALAVWALALSGGAALGVYAPKDGGVAAIALQDVQSDWTVQDGTLEISVTQFGSAVTGQFADWTAAISFDETVENGVAGTADVTIAIGSLTLGSVTDQAMGADYFDAAQFPTATFNAEIHPVIDGGYEARGTVTIRDQTVPVTLPFDLSLSGNTAEMQGTLTLDRRAFGIGDNQTDEGTLAFSVDVNVTLTASRAAPSS